MMVDVEDERWKSGKEDLWNKGSEKAEKRQFSPIHGTKR